ncbi:MAG: restriction endonuclease subunit S [Cyclobacteriaceae bacterium]
MVKIKPNGLPPGWQKVRLGDVCEKVVTVKRSLQEPTKEFLYLDIGGIDNRSNTIQEYKSFAWKDAPSRAQQIIKKNDVLFSTVRTYMRNIALVDKELFDNQIASSGFCLLRARPETINHKFIFYLTLSNGFLNPLNELQTGSSYPAVRDSDVFSQIISLPPLPTQHLIVTKLEELFSELDKGVEQLKLAQQQLKVYRQAVLKWAFEGRLNYDSSDSHDNYDETGDHSPSKNQKNHSADKGELPEGWKWVKLSSACNKIQDGSHFSPKIQHDKPGDGRYLYITAKNIRNNYMDLGKVTYVDRAFHESIYNRCNPELGDVLLTKDGVNTGEVTINTLNEPFSLLSSVCLFKTKRDQLEPTFLKYFIQSPLGSKSLTGQMTGTAIKRIILKRIKESMIVLPTIREQEQVVDQIESRLSVADKMEESINDALKQAEALRQSILKSAFDGRLVSEQSTTEPLLMAAEPQAAYTPMTISSDYPVVIKGITTTDLHAGVLSLVIDTHEKSVEHRSKLSRVKGEKIAHMVEAHLGIDLGRTPVKDAAGPDDYHHLMKVESRSKKANWFEPKKAGKIGHTYQSKRGLVKIIDRVKTTVPDKQFKGIEDLINLFLPMNLEQSEIVATVYAGWNNLLLQGKQPSDEEIVYESRENWSKRKEGIDRKRFFSALTWMREQGLIPMGRGKEVMAPMESRSIKKSKKS